MIGPEWINVLLLILGTIACYFAELNTKDNENDVP